MSSIELIRIVAGIALASMIITPFLTSTHLFITSAEDLATECRVLCTRLKVGSIALVAILIALCATVLGLCWELKSLFGLFIVCLYMLMAAYTFIFLPLGIILSRRNGGRLPVRYQPVRLFFAAAAIPLAVPTFITVIIIIAILMSIALCGVMIGFSRPYFHI
ncbi:MAG TPA: hypothetical protein PKC98_03565 [Candidatus Melainabacteria bacterium]|nr:hypothetical protein [Candidatus Melainabacteria bacterium]